MGQIQAGLTLFAVNDGTSVNGYLRVEPTPLIQRYNDAGVFTPDFESLAENMRPTVGRPWVMSSTPATPPE